MHGEIGIAASNKSGEELDGHWSRDGVGALKNLKQKL